MKDILPKMTKAQQLDSNYFNQLWMDMLEQGEIELIMPPDEKMWHKDLGYSLQIMFDWLGDITNKRVLELGCGPGDYTIMLARRGALVTAIDIAPSSLFVTNQRVKANSIKGTVDTGWMAAERLAFPDGYFDFVLGFGLLHHANPVLLAPEVRRVLRSGGRALFREPLGTNPLLHFVREYVPYRSKHRSPNENPLSFTDIKNFGYHFSTMRQREFYIFSMISRAVGGERFFCWLRNIDEYLLHHFNFTRAWARYVLVEYSA